MRSLPLIQIGKIGQMGIHQRRFSVTAMCPVLWLDAADPLSIVEVGGKVSQWKDKSGNRHNATQETVISQPETGVQTVNNRNLLTFDGLDDNMELNNINLFSIPSENNTIIFVWKTDDVDKEQRLFYGQYGGYFRWGLAYDIDDGYITGVNNSSYAPVNIAHGDDTNLHIDVLKRDNENVSVYRDGSMSVSSLVMGSDITVENLRIGSMVSLSAALKGAIAEIIVFKRALSDVELNKIGKYLEKKWCVSWANI